MNPYQMHLFNESGLTTNQRYCIPVSTTQQVRRVLNQLGPHPSECISHW